MKLEAEIHPAFEPPQTALLQGTHVRGGHDAFDAAFLAAAHPELYEGVQRMLNQLIAHALERLAGSNSNETAAARSLRPTPPDRQPRLMQMQVEPLSQREREVLERVAAGDSNKEIARAFDLSLHTVKRHVANILTKLSVTSRAQAGAWLRARH